MRLNLVRFGSARGRGGNRPRGSNLCRWRSRGHGDADCRNFRPGGKQATLSNTRQARFNRVSSRARRSRPSPPLASEVLHWVRDQKCMALVAVNNSTPDGEAKVLKAIGRARVRHLTRVICLRLARASAPSTSWMPRSIWDCTSPAAHLPSLGQKLWAQRCCCPTGRQPRHPLFAAPTVLPCWSFPGRSIARARCAARPEWRGRNHHPLPGKIAGHRSTPAEDRWRGEVLSRPASSIKEML